MSVTIGFLIQRLTMRCSGSMLHWLWRGLSMTVLWDALELCVNIDFVSDLVNNLKEVQKEVTGVDSEEEDADDSDHIILEMEERRGAGSVYDYFATSSRMDPSVFGQNMEINISAEGSRSLKRSRPEDIMVDKHQDPLYTDSKVGLRLSSSALKPP
ncbi:hypothetical protein DY000_02015186 [Brassica cretica]|uniref:Uncharacterized protein n=1 Tax=Brassica cretica TaxID=69181 RepID=A0ABQ7D2S7_BRACR|nr:hypothetical protein DY000_02015186 [Brassica cretica]